MKKILIVLLNVFILTTSVMAESDGETSQAENGTAEVLTNNEGEEASTDLPANNEGEEENIVINEDLSESEDVVSDIPADDVSDEDVVEDTTVELGEFSTDIIYNDEHTIATVVITYDGECDELTLNNQDGIQELVNIGVYQVDLERGDWINTIAFNILLNGAFTFEVNVWDEKELIGTKDIKGYITGLNNDSLLFEPNQTEQTTYEITSSDVGSSDSRNMTLSYETNVSFTWSIPTELPMEGIEDDLTITVNNSNLATETALRIRVASNNDYKLVEPESGESLSYIIKDLSNNVVRNDDVILDHLYNQDSTSNTIHFDLTQMPVMSGKYEDTLTFTASIERLLSDLYSGQTVTLSNLGTTHNLTNMKIYGVSKQDGTPTPDNPVEIQSVVNPTVMVSGKNLLNPTLETVTLNGVTCTQNIGPDGLPDGTYTLNGTAENDTVFTVMSNINIIKEQTYKLVGCPDGGSLDTYFLSTHKLLYADTGDGYIRKASINIDDDWCYIYVKKGSTVNNLVFKPMLTTDLNTTYDNYEPYAGAQQSATLNYTLNAIPVSEGGNITVNGQQYISDYVDIENKKLVRMVYESAFDGSDDEGWREHGNGYIWLPLSHTSVQNYPCFSDRYPCISWSYLGSAYYGINMSDTFYAFACIQNKDVSTLDEFKAELAAKPTKVLHVIDTPTEINLTDSEVQAFKDLYTYSPTTVVSCSSDQLTPCIEFSLS